MINRIGGKTCLAIGSGFFLTLLVCSSFGVPLVFTIDPAQSTISGSGTFGGATINEQGPGSLDTTFGGTVDLDLDDVLSPTSVTISNMTLDAVAQGPWLPGVGGTGTAALADVAGAVQGTSGIFAFLFNVAVRDLLVSGMTPSAVPVVSNTFASTSLQFTLTSANMDYSGSVNQIGASGTTSLAGLSSNNLAGAGSLSYSNNTATLTIPINFTLVKNVGIFPANFPLILTCSGILVATAPVGGDTNQPAVQCSLTPATATNFVGELHTVTATITTNSTPISGVTVDFAVISGPNTGALGSDVTDGNGQATNSYSSATAGTDVIQATGMVDGQSFTCTATKVWAATSIGCSLLPADATNLINTAHSVTANVSSNGVPVSAVNIDFLVLSGPNAGDAGTNLTDSVGDATFTYTGDGGVGTDIIQAVGLVGGNAFTCTATKVWLDIMVDCSLSPPTATNLVDTVHTVTANVTVNGTPAPGVAVNFEVIAGPNIGESVSNGTDVSGDASFPYTGAGGAGTDTIQATGAFAGHSFTCTATKVWVPLTPSCSLSPQSDTNQVGTSHSVVVTVTVNTIATPAVSVDFAVVSGPNAGASVTQLTDINGHAAFTYPSNGSPGTDTIMATGSVSGVSFSCSATKLWETGPCANLSGTWSKVKNKCKLKNGVLGCKVSGKLTILNSGSVDSGDSVVQFFLSSDTTLDGGDLLLADETVKPIKVGKTGKVKGSVQLTEVDTVGKFVIAVIDSGNAISECNENDNIAVTPPLP